MTVADSSPHSARGSWALAALLALVLVAGHVRALPAWLEDIDSVNFALGVRDFDVAAHRPHPPGYPVYIAAGKVATALTRAAWPEGAADRVEGRALAGLSLVSAVLLVPVALLAFAALGAGGRDRLAPHVPDRRARIALTLLVASPLMWHMTARPMSDMLGLAAATAAQAALLAAFRRQRPIDGDRRLTPEEMAASGRLIVVGALLTGLAIGVRSQVAWLTLPLLVVMLVDRIGRGAAGALLGSAMTGTIGALAWAIPLVVVSGGPAAYLAALGTQAGEDFSGVDMLSLNPSLRLLALTLARTFVWPWEHEALAAVVLLLAAAGALVLLVSERRTLVAVSALAVPYLAFHLAFHDTTFARYALPLVVPTVFLAACALDRAGRVVAVAGTGLLAAASLGLALPVFEAYTAQPSPMTRAFDVLAEEDATEAPVTVAMHFPFKRPLEAETRPIGTTLAPTPRREWLDLARYWTGGGAAPLWFLADPLRTDLALIDPQARRDVQHFGWHMPGLSRVGGMRPIDVDLYRLPVPGWFAEDGWSLTPEAAGMARLMGRGPHLGPITARVRRRSGAMRGLVGGRNLGAAGDPAVRVTLAVDGRPRETWDVTPAPGFFLRAFELPAGALDGEGTWAALTLEARPVSGDRPVATAIEQFDLQDPGVMLWGFDEGWHEAEFDPVRLQGWRWMSERALLRVEQATTPLTLELRGDSPLRTFDGPSTLTVRAGARQLARVELRGDFTIRVGVLPGVLAEAGGRLELTTTQTFVPAEHGAAADRRALGLRLFSVALTPGLPGQARGAEGASGATSR